MLHDLICSPCLDQPTFPAPPIAIDEARQCIGGKLITSCWEAKSCCQEKGEVTEAQEGGANILGAHDWTQSIQN